MSNHNKCPLTIVTGFLGSGKTTLLSRILRDNSFAGTSVIINEYGEVGLDHRFIRRIEERTTLLSGGCVCCNRRDDLVNELRMMLNSSEQGEIPLDRVIVETTGLADPAPILFSIFTHPLLVHHFYIDMVLTCLDAVNGELHLNGNPESVKQIVAADKVIITKTDLIAEKNIKQLQEKIQQLNPAADIMTSSFGKMDIASIFCANQPHGVRVMSQDKEKQMQEIETKPGGKHGANIHSMSIQFTKPLDWVAFGLWMSMLLHVHGEKIFRVKGIVDVGEAGPIIINGVQHIIHPPQHLANWRDDEEQVSQIVFIMKDINPQEILASLQAFQNMIGAKPEIQEINMDPFA